MRRGIAIVSVLAGILLITGCTPRFDKIVGKTKGDDKVKVKFTICVRDFDNKDPEVCADDPEAESRQRGSEDINHLIAIRAPKKTDVPNTLRTVATSEGQSSISYTKSGQYKSELRQNVPTPEGTKWYGFISEPLTDVPVRARYKLIMGLPPDPGRKFKYRPVTGFTANESGEKNVDCPDPFEESGCVTDPQERSEIRRSLKINLD
jgi:hypothetical protein